MKRLKVPDMHCEMCVKRITKVLADAALDFAVFLEDRVVTVNGDEAQVKKALEALDDLGFEARVLKES